MKKSDLEKQIQETEEKLRIMKKAYATYDRPLESLISEIDLSAKKIANMMQSTDMFSGISPEFLTVRTGGEYRYKGLYLCHPRLKDDSWTVVSDKCGAEILVMKSIIE